MDFYHKFRRSVPEIYDIVTLLVRSDVKTATPTVAIIVAI